MKKNRKKLHLLRHHPKNQHYQLPRKKLRILLHRPHLEGSEVLEILIKRTIKMSRYEVHRADLHNLGYDDGLSREIVLHSLHKRQRLSQKSQIRQRFSHTINQQHSLEGIPVHHRGGYQMQVRKSAQNRNHTSVNGSAIQIVLLILRQKFNDE